MENTPQGGKVVPTPSSHNDVYQAPTDEKRVRQESQEDTQAKIARYFTIGFLVIVVLSILIPFVVSLANPGLTGNPLESSKELILVVASVLAGPFGFIIGFYFKQKES